MTVFELAIVVLLLAQPAAPEVEPETGPRFIDVAPHAGVRATFRSDFQPGRFYLPTIMAGSVAWFDADNDGWIDLFVASGCRLPLQPPSPGAAGRLYRNGQDGSFSLCPAIGFDGARYSQGLAPADFDNDGFVDLVVTSLQGAVLYANRGDGTFTDVTEQVGIGATGWPTGAAFGDLDRDGALDLYIVRYVATTLAESSGWEYEQRGGTVRGFCGPSEWPALADLVWLNDGAGAFANVTEASGCRSAAGKGLGVAIADLTGDGWPDVYVANDTGANFLWENVTGRDPSLPPPALPRFRETAGPNGVAWRGAGQPGGSMGIGVGDWNADARLDLAVTEYLGEGTSLYTHRHDGFYESGPAAGLAAATVATLGFGVAFLDADNDGWLDLFQANGHVLGPHVAPTVMRAQLFQNHRGLYFKPRTTWAGSYFFTEHLGRGAAVGDFDNDGRTDLAVVHLDEPAALLRNATRNGNHFLGIELVGSRSNRGAIGAQVFVTVGGKTRLFEVIGGGSYLSASDGRILIGLGRNTSAERLGVRWTDGVRRVLPSLPIDRYSTVIESCRAGEPVRLQARQAHRESARRPPRDRD